MTDTQTRIEELEEALSELREEAKALETELDDWEIEEDKCIDAYEDMLDEVYGTDILGSYAASYVLKNSDETAYNTGLSEYVASLDKADDPVYREKAEELSELEAEIGTLEDELDELREDGTDEDE